MATFADQLGIYPVSQLSDIDFYKQQLASSGITPDLADFNGFILHAGFYEMPYFDIDGEDAGVSSRRNNTTDKDRRYGRHRGRGKGIEPRCYWPLHPALTTSHRELLGADVTWPLWIVEGERKALCLQDRLISTGLKGSVVSVPGVTNFGAVLRETKHVYMKGGELARPVWIVYDWNHTNMMVQGSEANLFDAMAARGADVHCLRWTDRVGDGEQKIDDYLVAGNGSLEDAIRYSADNAAIIPREDYRWLNEHYAVMDGRVIKLSGGASMSKAEFLVDTAHMQEVGGSTKAPTMVPTGQGWLQWQYRTVVTGRTVQLVPPGQVPSRVVEGRINLARHWPITTIPDDMGTECQVFDHHLLRFCETEAHWVWLRQHIAHMILRPMETTSNAVAFADEGGTGKGLLMSILSRVLGDLFVAVSSELTTKFNDNLVGRLLAHYDEPPSDKWEGGVLDKATKRLVGNHTVTIEGKGTRAYTVENRIRLFVTTNLQTVYGIPETERRWNYFCGREKLSPVDAATVAALRDAPDLPARIVRWAEGVCLDGYDPMQRGPTSTARIMAVEASRGPVEYFLQECDELDNGPDIWEASKLYDLFRAFSGGGRVMGKNTFGAELTRLLGRESAAVVKVDGGAKRLRAVRNVQRWGVTNCVEWARALRAEQY